MRYRTRPAWPEARRRNAADALEALQTGRSLAITLEALANPDTGTVAWNTANDLVARGYARKRYTPIGVALTLVPAGADRTLPNHIRKESAS